MNHYELTIRTANTGTSFLLRAERDDEAVERVFRIAAALDVVGPPAFIELTRDGRRIPCKVAGAGSASTPTPSQ